MRAGQAFVAGVVGGCAMALTAWVLRSAGGVLTDLPLIWGTLLLPKGWAAWLLGLVIHLVASGLVALVYAWAFEHSTHRAGAWTGVLFSLVHSVVAGLALGLMPGMHPRIPDAMPAPGYFMIGYGGLSVVALFVIHAIYGAVVGAMYHPVHAGAARMRVRPSEA